jgi:hypothetical protein
VLTTRQKIALGIVLNKIASGIDVVPLHIKKITEKYNLISGVKFENDSECARELLTLDNSIRMSFIADIINLVPKNLFKYYLKASIILFQNNIILIDNYIIYNIITNIIYDCSFQYDRRTEITLNDSKISVKFIDKLEGDFYELSIRREFNGELIIKMGHLYSFKWQKDALEWFEHSRFLDFYESLSREEKMLIPIIKAESFNYHYNHLDGLHVIICKLNLITNY